MKYIKLFEQFKDYEIMTVDSDSIINELKKEIEKDDYDIEYIKDLITYGHFDVNYFWFDYDTDDDPDGMVYETNFLIRVSVLNKPEIIELLLEAGADINIEDNDGNTPLIWASYKNNSQAVQELLKHPDIDVNVQGKDSTTALMLATINKNIQVIQVLLKQPNIDVTLTNDDNSTAWDLASDKIREQFPELNPDLL